MKMIQDSSDTSPQLIMYAGPGAAAPDRALTPAEVAKITGLCIGTLANMRVEGTGPEFYKYGKGPSGAVRYSESAVLAWREAHLRRSTSDAGLPTRNK